MKKEIESKLRTFFKIDNDYENYRGVHYYEDINVSEYSKRMEEIRKAVANASDKEIGLPFQLKMLFGEDGKALSEELAGHYEELKN